MIDNHSTDDTVSIVKSYGDSRIQCYLIHNEGVIAKSRNYGITFAKGDYVEAGHVLGYVGEPTKYFTVEGSNLYFELDKDGTPVDPVAYFE